MSADLQNSISNSKPSATTEELQEQYLLQGPAFRAAHWSVKEQAQSGVQYAVNKHSSTLNISTGCQNFLPSQQRSHSRNIKALLSAASALPEHTYQDKFKKCALVYFQKLLIPHRDVICSFLFVLIILRRRWIILVMSAPLNHLVIVQTLNFYPNDSPIRPEG